VDVLKGSGVVAENVDVVELSENEPLRTKGRWQGIQECSDAEGEHERSERITLAHLKGTGVGCPSLPISQVRSRPIGPSAGSVEVRREAAQPRGDFSSANCVECVAEVEGGEVSE
jgi:hypothetical protein